MKKPKKIISTILITLGVCGIISGIVYVRYSFWRAEHPQAKTWTFFIPHGGK